MKRKTAASDKAEASKGKNYPDPYENLAAAIVMQAARDYLDVYGKMLRARNDRELWKLQPEKEKLEAFFYSRWYSRLTEVDPDKLLSWLRDKAVQNEKARLAGKRKA